MRISPCGDSSTRHLENSLQYSCNDFVKIHPGPPGSRSTNQKATKSHSPDSSASSSFLIQLIRDDRIPRTPNRSGNCELLALAIDEMSRLGTLHVFLLGIVEDIDRGERLKLRAAALTPRFRWSCHRVRIENTAEPRPLLWQSPRRVRFGSTLTFAFPMR